MAAEKKEIKETKKVAEKTKKVSKKKVPTEKLAMTRGKRKEAVARAVVRKGTGRVTINKFAIETLGNKYLKAMIYEPITLAGNAAKAIDIDVTVYGGGQMGQAEAARQAIARGMIEFTGDAELKHTMLEYDRYLVTEDARRVEPKKYKGPKARARFQKSYR